MNNVISCFEIPASDFNRAKAFYNDMLQCEIHEAEMMGTKMGFFPSDGTNVSGALVQGEDYTPTSDGTMVYLNGGDDLSGMLAAYRLQEAKYWCPRQRYRRRWGILLFFLIPKEIKLRCILKTKTK